MIRDQNDKEMELQNQILQQQFQLEKEKKRSARILSKFRDVRNAYREIKSKLVEERERNKRIVTSLRRRLNEMQPKQKNIKTNAGAILDSSRLYDAIIAQHVDGALSHKHLEQFFSVFSYTYPFAASSRREHVDRDTFKHILDGTLRANNIKCVLSLSLYPLSQRLEYYHLRYDAFLHNHAIPYLLSVNNTSTKKDQKKEEKNESMILVQRSAFAEKRFSTKLKRVFRYYATMSESSLNKKKKKRFNAISQDQCRRMLRDFRLSPGLMTRREVNKMFFSKYRSDMVFSATIKYNELISLLKSIAEESFPEEKERGLVSWMEKSRGFEKITLVFNELFEKR